MKIFEVADNMSDMQEVEIVNLLQLIGAKADERNVAAVMPIDSFLKLLDNIGHTMDLEEFEALKGSSQIINNMVSSINDKEVVISSKKNPNDSDTDISDVDPSDSNKVSSMAKRAATRRT